MRIFIGLHWEEPSMKRITLLALLLVCPTLWADAYAQLLAKYVKADQIQGIQLAAVDYAAWAGDPLHLQAMQELQVRHRLLGSHSSAAESMAYWINAYNLLTIDLIIKHREKQSIRNLGTWFRSVWKTHRWSLNQQEITLHQIEHEILRPMGDARIHFAINCASLSCPDLRDEPYRAERLSIQLDAQAQRFLAQPNKGFQWSNGEAKISKIFDWFEEDFTTNGGVKPYLINQTHQQIDSIRYLPYNWTLNGHW